MSAYITMTMTQTNLWGWPGRLWGWLRKFWWSSSQLAPCHQLQQSEMMLSVTTLQQSNNNNNDETQEPNFHCMRENSSSWHEVKNMTQPNRENWTNFFSQQTAPSSLSTYWSMPTGTQMKKKKYCLAKGHVFSPSALHMLTCGGFKESTKRNISEGNVLFHLFIPLWLGELQAVLGLSSGRSLSDPCVKPSPFCFF